MFRVDEICCSYVLVEGVAFVCAGVEDAIVDGSRPRVGVGSYDGVQTSGCLPKARTERERENERMILRLSKGIRQENQRAVLGTARTPTYSTVSYPCDNCAPLLRG
jgi:hypothetical protein